MNNLEEFTNHSIEVMAVKKVTILLYCLAAAAISTIFYVKAGNIPGQINRPSNIVLSTPENSMSSYSTSKAPSSQEIQSGTPASESNPDVYIVKTYKGHIGVFRGEDATPFEEFSTDVSILPKDDQIVLEKGKVLHSMSDVKKLMEDYDG